MIKAAASQAIANSPKVQALVAKLLEERGIEYAAIAKISKEVIEQIAWEVVPQVAEALIKENLSELAKNRPA